jgi:hypothetical protein
MGFARRLMRRKWKKEVVQETKVPQSAAICKATRNHHWGVCERGVISHDGVVTWQTYRGCLRCGLEQ